MYSISQTDFGDSILLRLQNNHTGAYVQVLPGYGGALQQVCLPAGGQLYPLLWTNDDPEGWEQEAVPWYKGAWLAPYPDRVEKGRYTFNQTEFQLPLNQQEEGHALHGFTNDFCMQVSGTYTNAYMAELVLQYQYPGNVQGYPFPFFVEHKYQLNHEGLRITTTIQNTGSSVMPFGMGWHPYLAVDVSSPNVLLKVEAEGSCPVDKNNIPTGETELVNPFASFSPVSYRNTKEMLFMAFVLDKSKPDIVTTLQDKFRQIEISVWQQNQQHGYAYLQVFTMDGLGGIAIEPFTCMANAFNNGNGLMRLNPEQAITTSFGMQVQSII